MAVESVWRVLGRVVAQVAGGGICVAGLLAVFDHRDYSERMKLRSELSKAKAELSAYKNKFGQCPHPQT